MTLVEVSLVEAAFAKINLTLRVLGRRADGYHEIESLVTFADVGDMLRLQTGAPLSLQIEGPYAGACGAPTDNLVLKAAAALSARVEGLRLGRFVLTKELPVASGIGGGSADAAAALRLLVHGNRQIFVHVDFTDSRIQAAALAVGADVPVCLESKARVMRGIGEKLSPLLDLPPLPAVLVNPGVPLSTREVFGKFTLAPGGVQSSDNLSPTAGTLRDYLAHHGNDLTQAAVACVPAVAAVLQALRALPGAKLARMSGSGATCFALFDSTEGAAAAAQTLKVAHKDWWIQPTTLNL